MKFSACLGLGFFSVLCLASAAQAGSVTVTKAVQENCRWDYDKFCNQYGIGSELLDMFFRQNGQAVQGLCGRPDRGRRRLEGVC
jgi:hypothetical protein